MKLSSNSAFRAALGRASRPTPIAVAAFGVVALAGGIFAAPGLPPAFSDFAGGEPAGLAWPDGLPFLLLGLAATAGAGRRHARIWALDRTTTACFVAGVLVLLGVCAVAFHALNSFAETAARVAQTHRVQAEIGQLQRALIDIMTARRAHLAAPDERHLAAVRAAAQRASELLASLTRLTADNPRQQSHIEELDRILVGPLARALDPLPPRSEPPPVPAGSANPRSQSSNEELLGIFGRMNAEEEAQLRGREEKAKWNFDFAMSAVPAGSLASVLLLSAALLLLNREAGERRRVQEDIRRLNLELELRVQERTAQFEDALRELESFSYSVSHDLRAPLRHVQGFVAMLQRETEGQLSDKARRHLKIITDSSIEMGRLIDDLLDFSRMGRVEMCEGRVSLDRLLQETRHRMEAATQGRNIVWKNGPLPEVIGDASMLRQVMTNLIGNAVKYTRRQDPASIEIGCNGEEDGRAVFYVRDNGAGFDMQYASKLFGVFQRLHRADEFEGTGIGLAIVRRVISRHGGRVWAEGAPQKGATFYFTLRRATHPSGEKPPHRHS